MQPNPTQPIPENRILKNQLWLEKARLKPENRALSRHPDYFTMRFCRPFILLSAFALCLLPSCRTQREIISGPTNTGLDTNASGGLGGSRFSNRDPYGYMDNSSKGLNTMSEKMFDGKLEETGAKQFNSSRSFLTREYSSKRKKFQEKEFAGARSGRSDWEGELFETGNTRDDALKFQSAERRARTGESSLAGKMKSTGEFADADKTAVTGEYYPAAQAASPQRSKPPVISQGSENQKSRVKSLIGSRAGSGDDDGISINDIRSLVGKQ